MGGLQEGVDAGVGVRQECPMRCLESRGSAGGCGNDELRAAVGPLGCLPLCARDAISVVSAASSSRSPIHGHDPDPFPPRGGCYTAFRARACSTAATTPSVSSHFS